MLINKACIRPTEEDQAIWAPSKTFKDEEP